MRIVGGKYRGKKLPYSAKMDLRPTTDFAKESLFNLLNNKIDLEGISFLDLFSGTGNISYELISRGAGLGTCVDISAPSFKYRKGVIETMDFEELKSLKMDVFKFMRSSKRKFDLVFADPPYDLSQIPELPDLVFQHALLKADGLFVLEHPEDHTFGGHPHFSEHRRYGRVNFTFFK